MLPFHSFLRGVIQSVTPTDFYESVFRYYINHVEQKNSVLKLSSNKFGIVKSHEFILVATLDKDKTTMTDLYSTLKQSTDKIFDNLFIKDTKSRSNALKKAPVFWSVRIFPPDRTKIRSDILHKSN